MFYRKLFYQFGIRKQLMQNDFTVNSNYFKIILRFFQISLVNVDAFFRRIWI